MTLDHGGGTDEATDSFGDHVPLPRLLLRYAVTGLVVLMLVAVVTAYASRRLGTEEAIEDARRVATIAATAAVEPTLTDDLIDMDPDALRRVDEIVRNQVLRGPLVRVKIWSADGTIVYSDESRLIGERFELDDEAEAILWGGPGDAEAEVSDLAEPENRFEEPATKLLEVYLPIYTPSDTPMLFEAYFLYDGVSEAGQRAWLRFAPVTLGSLLLLGLLQVPLVFSLATKLRSTQDQRKRLLERAIEAENAERRRIASDLHDGVVQDLAGVTFALGAVSRRLDGGQREQIAQIGDQVRDAIRSLRSLLVEIYPPNLDDEGLEAALSDLMARLDPRGIAAELTVDGAVKDLPVDVSRLLYRTAQEGLRNIVAHANATTVKMSVDAQPDRVVLRVIDDGRGFDPERAPIPEGHLGLRALSGFASSLGATVHIDSAEGRGTELQVEVPLR